MRTGLIVLGGVLLVLAVGSGLRGWRHRRLWMVLAGTPVTLPSALIAASVAGELGPGLRAVTGQSAAGPDGELLSTVNHEPAVWHRHAVVHQQVRYRTDSKGRSRRSSSRKKAGDVRTRDPFCLVDPADVTGAGPRGAGTGGPSAIEVRPDRMRVDRPHRRGTRILPGMASQPFPEEVALSFGSVQHSYHHREWVIAPGTSLYVLGEAVGRGRRVVVRRPARGPHLVSTRPVRQLVVGAAIATVGWLLLAVLALGGAVAAAVFALS